MPDHKSILSPLPSIPEELTPAEEEAAAKAAAKKEAIRQENLKRSLKEIVDSEQCYGDSLEALIGTLESIISSELASELASPSSRKKMNEILPPLRAMLLLSKKISSELSEVLAKNTMDCQNLFKVLKGIFDPKKKFEPAIIFDTDGKFRQDLLASLNPQKNSWFGMYVKYPAQYEELTAELIKLSDQKKNLKPIQIANELLITPAQRLMRYPMLMEATIGYTLSEQDKLLKRAPDTALKDALDTVKGVVMSINETKRVAEEEAKQLAALQANKSRMSCSAPALLFSAKSAVVKPRFSSDSPPRPPTGASRLH